MNKKKKITIGMVTGLGLLALIGAAVYFFVFEPAATFDEQNAIETIDRPEIDLAFSYLAGPAALSLFEPSSVEDPVLAAFIIMPSSDFLKVRSQEAVDTPPSISLFVFDYPERQQLRIEESASSTEPLSRKDRLRLWGESNEGFTGISTIEGEIEEVEVDGLKGIRFTNQATYSQTIYLFSYQEKMFLFAGQFETDGDEMQRYFSDILASISFN